MEIIFDFDGTLADECGPPMGWVMELMRTHGYRGTDEEAHIALQGCTDFDIPERLGLRGNREELVQRIVEANRRALGNAVWLPDQLEILTRLAREYTLLVLSNRDQASLELGLETIGCRDLFGAIVGALPGLPGKPSLDLYHKLRAQTGSPHEAGVYVGDKPIDRRFAELAGLHFIGACWHRDLVRNDEAACFAIGELPSRILKLSTKPVRLGR